MSAFLLVGLKPRNMSTKKIGLFQGFLDPFFCSLPSLTFLSNFTVMASGCSQPCSRQISTLSNSIQLNPADHELQSFSRFSG